MWYCDQCSFFVFTTKIYCAKCLTPNPLHKDKFNLQMALNSSKKLGQVFSSNDFSHAKNEKK